MPGKGFLWHLRRHLCRKERRREGAGLASDTDGRTLLTGGQRRERGGGGKEGITEKEKQREQTGRPGGEDVDVSIKGGQEARHDDLVVVLPPPGGRELPGYTGGYTVKRHGLLAGQQVPPGSFADGAARATAGGTEGAGRVAVAVDAVQLEFGARFRRTPEACAAAAEAVAAAVFHHLQQQ